MLGEVIKQRKLFHEYLLFKVGMVMADLIVWAYYYILLFIQTNSLQILLLDALINCISGWIGFVIGSLLLDKLGYLVTFRISHLLQGLTLLLILVFLKEIGTLFILFAIARGFGRGIYWPVDHSYNLKEVHGARRGELISILMSIIQLLRIIIPVLTGALLSYTNDYQTIFILGMTIHVVIIFMPFTYNKKTRSSIQSEEIVRIMSSPHFYSFFFLNVLSGGVRNLYVAFFLIIPYLLIREEILVGGLVSGAALIAVFVTYIKRKSTLQNKIVMGFIGYSIFAATHILLSFIWSIPALIIRSIGIVFSDSLGDGVLTDLDYRVREKFLGKYKNESAIEMNLITETAYLIGRVFFFSLFLLVFSTLSEQDMHNFIRLGVGILAPSMLIILLWSILLNKKIHHPAEFKEVLETKIIY